MDNKKILASNKNGLVTPINTYGQNNSKLNVPGAPKICLKKRSIPSQVLNNVARKLQY